MYYQLSGYISSILSKAIELGTEKSIFSVFLIVHHK